MKHANQLSGRRLFLASLLFLIPFLFTSCAKKMTFATSAVEPAAIGDVRMKTDKNMNYAIELTVTHLAGAERLTPPKKTYIAWMVTEANGTMNIGQLSSKRSLFSRTQTGSLKTVTSLKPLSFFITAEDDASAQYPGTPVVLTTR